MNRQHNWEPFLYTFFQKNYMTPTIICWKDIRCDVESMFWCPDYQKTEKTFMVTAVLTSMGDALSNAQKETNTSTLSDCLTKKFHQKMKEHT